jgi:hypothetical protein
MKGQTDLGPSCPGCGSGAWRFADAHRDFHRRDGTPATEVTAAAVCEECERSFHLELSLSGDSVWRTDVVPQSFGPLVGFTWLDRTLYARGRTLSGDGTHYHEEYALEAVRTGERGPEDGVRDDARGDADVATKPTREGDDGAADA